MLIAVLQDSREWGRAAGRQGRAQREETTERSHFLTFSKGLSVAEGGGLAGEGHASGVRGFHSSPLSVWVPALKHTRQIGVCE